MSEAHEGPLAGLVVVDLSTTLPGAQTTQFLADAGAQVIFVEGPKGSPLRSDPGWPSLLRGKRSVVIDLGVAEQRSRLDELLEDADVLVTTMRPAAAERLGLTAERLAADHPRLVTAMITGWGTRGPWANYKGYEPLIYAKTGVLHSKRQLTPGPDPAYVSVPYASFGASQAAIQGILAALFERERSGSGQVVESNLVTGVGAHDPYNWFYEMILRRYPDAFKPQIAAFDDAGRPQSRLMYGLLVAATKDGSWLQFAHSSPRLTQGWLEELGLAEEVRDPKWADFPDLPTAELRAEWWVAMLDKVRERTLADWQEVFALNPNIFGEQFRSPEEALEHPQVVHEGRVVTVEDPDLGPVRQTSTLVHAGGAPIAPIRRAPRLGEHTDEIRGRAGRRPGPSPSSGTGTSRGLPLEGVTLLELGSMFAGPYGATLLADLGARVIKVEPLEGDTIRFMMAFPEAGGGKVLQGKESIAVDIRTGEGLAIVQDLVRQSDVVLQCFRGGVAERAGIDEASLKAINPDLVYISSPGYGTEGPYGHKPAYAPSIGAASGISMTDAPKGGRRPDSQQDVMSGAANLWAGGAVPAVQADGIAALGVGSGLLLGLIAKQRGTPLSQIETTMLASCTQALGHRNTSYAGRRQLSQVDDMFRGLGPLYRLYRASDGWVFLAAPLKSEWSLLTSALNIDELLEPRFATKAGRRAEADALAQILERVFESRPKDEWEKLLTGHDVGCVAVAQENAEWQMQTDTFHSAGYAVEADSPIFGEHRRLAPLNVFSRSTTKADAGCTIGQHTDSILAELGRSTEDIARLRSEDVVR